MIFILLNYVKLGKQTQIILTYLGCELDDYILRKTNPTRFSIKKLLMAIIFLTILTCFQSEKVHLEISKTLTYRRYASFPWQSMTKRRGIWKNSSCLFHQSINNISRILLQTKMLKILAYLKKR